MLHHKYKVSLTSQAITMGVIKLCSPVINTARYRACALSIFRLWLDQKLKGPQSHFLERRIMESVKRKKNKLTATRPQTNKTLNRSGSWGGGWRLPLLSPSQEQKVGKSALAAITGRVSQITVLLFVQNHNQSSIVRSPVGQKSLWLPNTIKSL